MTKRQAMIERGLLATVVATYVALGVLYATLTPRWQAPDEPAHYNYVRHLAEQKRFPILQMGDYDQAYLREITSRRFDPALPIDSIRYESHQPPLYYVLAAPLYALCKGAVLPLRLLSVGFGAGLLVVAYQVGKAMHPERAWPALGTAAFIAFNPQHIAMTASINNDALAELLLGTVLLGLIRWLKSDTPARTKSLIQVGVLIGLALLTKVGVYITVPLALVAIWLKFFRPERHDERCPQVCRHTRVGLALASAVALLLPALLLSLPWFVRNVLAYGGLDVLGLGQHERVVAGQPLTADFLAEHGWLRLAGDFVSTTFRSFWAMFGWMAVPIDGRIYLGLRTLSMVVLMGLFLWVMDRGSSAKRLSSPTLLLACSALLTLGTYLGYNVTFYQAQGRYLFPALIPLGLAWSLGLHESLRRDNVRMIGIALTLAAALGAIKWLSRASGKWQILVNGSGAVFTIARQYMPESSGNWFFAVPYLLLAALCAVSPFWFIIPYLTP